MKTNKDMEQDEEGKMLSSMNKENTFSTPDSYFDHLPQRMMDKIHSKQQKQTFFLIRPVPAFTLVFSGILLLILLFLNKNTAIPSENTLSDNEVQQVIDNPELYNIDEALITAYYISSSVSNDENNETTFSDDEIKSYLEENTDINTIINEL